jgi:hypothetical protein
MDYCTECGRTKKSGADAPHKLGASWWATMTVAALLLAIGGLGITRFVLRSAAASEVTTIVSKTPAPALLRRQPGTQPSLQALPTEQAAAQSLSRLLAQSAADRTAITNAFDDVNACGSGLAQDAQAFQQAAASRKQLMSQLSALKNDSVLPALMLQDLSGAWQASYQADQDYADWAADENSEGCTSNDTSDSHYQAAAGPDTAATTDKEAFVSAWNAIAGQYGLTTYQQNQL